MTEPIPPKAAWALAAFIAAVVLANWMTTRYGLVKVGFGLTATAGTFAAGLTFSIRDALSELAGRWWVIYGIAIGALITLVLSPSLALASATAFTVSELLDLGVYEQLRSKDWRAAVFFSNVVGGVVDTSIFLWLAGFPIVNGLGGQMYVKTAMTVLTLVVVALFRASRAVPREPEYAAHR